MAYSRSMPRETPGLHRLSLGILWSVFTSTFIVVGVALGGLMSLVGLYLTTKA